MEKLYSHLASTTISYKQDTNKTPYSVDNTLIKFAKYTFSLIKYLVCFSKTYEQGDKYFSLTSNSVCLGMRARVSVPYSRYKTKEQNQAMTANSN